MPEQWTGRIGHLSIFLWQMKKSAVFFFLFFNLLIGVHAQYNSLADLRKELDNHPQQDTARVNRLIGCASVSFLPDGERQKFAEEALSISRKLNYKRGEGFALSYLGLFKSRKEPAEGLRILQQSDSLARQIDDSTIIGITYFRKGVSLLNQGYKTGLDTVLKVAKIFERQNNFQRLALSYITLANNYSINYSNYPAAMEYLVKAKAAEEKSAAAGEWPNTSDLATQVHNSFGTLYLLLGDYDKALNNFKKAEQLINKSGADIRQTDLPNNMGEVYRLTGKYPEAIAAYNQGLLPDKGPFTMEIYESNMADVYTRMDNLPLAFQHGFKALKIGKEIQDEFTLTWTHSVLARAYLKKEMPDSSIYHARQGLDLGIKVGTTEFIRDNALALSRAYAFKKDFADAYKYHLQYVSANDSMLSAEVKNRTAVLEYSSDLEKKQSQITQLNQQKKIQQNFLYSSAVVLVLILLTAGLLLRNNRQKQKANKLLLKQRDEIDQKAHELEASYNNVELLGEIGRKITSSLSVEKIISTVYNNVNTLMDANVFGIGIYNEAKQQIEFPATYEEGQVLSFYTNSIHDKNRFAAVCLNSGQEINMGNMNAEYSKYINEIATPHAGGQPVSLIFLPLIFKDKKLGVITVQSFKENAYSDYQLYMLRNIGVYTAIALENAESYEELNHTVERLKSTQAQLIQSEKMASLGELTAGIAHEIQNPLNFVNNFSEVNTELIDELTTELQEGNIAEARAIAGNIRENERKIMQHGKRADVIVKGMLQHSRSETGIKQLTDINSLCDEYLKLSYHGLRARDNTFNAVMETHFDEKLKPAEIIPQDIARVLLNVYNNAFYAVQEKKKTAANGYEPVVSVRTEMAGNKIRIYIKDNGTGMPQKVAV
ncbi:MAG: tetratricopeptide repeat protein [Nitrospira sp.]